MSVLRQPPSTAPTAVAITPERAKELESRLASVLAELEANQRAMLACCERQRVAMRKADLAAVKSANEEHAKLLRETTQVDATRALLIKEFSPGNASTNPRGAASLRDLAQRLSGEPRERLLAAAERVRDLMLQAQKARVALRVSAATLADHMEGLARSVARKLSHAGTYSGRGVVEARQLVVSGLDLKS